MKKNLKYYMREPKEEVVTVKGPSSFVDEDGEVLNLEIKALPNAAVQKVFRAYTKRGVALDSKGNPYIANGEIVFQSEKDNPRAMRHLIVDALQFPDLRDKELMQFYKCHDITEMPNLVFSKPEEYAHVSRVVMAVLGVGGNAIGDDELVQDAKN